MSWATLTIKIEGEETGNDNRETKAATTESAFHDQTTITLKTEPEPPEPELPDLPYDVDSIIDYDCNAGKCLPSTKPKKIQCPTCKKVISSISYRDHQNLHTNEKPYKCTQCPKAYPSVGGLDLHKKTHVLEPQECPTCHKVLQHIMGLKQHMKRVHRPAEPNYICPEPECPAIFRHAKDLRRHHLAVHSDAAINRQFTCKFCDARFKTKGTLTVHYRVHTMEKPYTCQYCKQEFMNHSSKERHERVHTRQKPYQCEICEQSFARIDTWKDHVQSVHQLKRVFACRFCKVRFKTAGARAAHERKCHPEEQPRRKLQRGGRGRPDQRQPRKQRRFQDGNQEAKEALSEGPESPATLWRGYQCSFCGESFFKEEECERHQSAVHLASVKQEVVVETPETSTSFKEQTENPEIPLRSIKDEVIVEVADVREPESPDNTSSTTEEERCQGPYYFSFGEA